VCSAAWYSIEKELFNYSNRLPAFSISSRENHYQPSATVKNFLLLEKKSTAEYRLTRLGEERQDFQS
jgi:hypothetical protein